MGTRLGSGGSRAGRLLLPALVLCSPAIALAHVTLQTKEAPASGHYKAVIKVGHGCDGTPTTEIRVKIPDGMQAVEPMSKPGWKVQAIRSKSAGDVAEIRWTGGRLPDGDHGEFVFDGKLPDGPAGTRVYFPVVQICEKGENRWIGIPADGQDPDDLDEPAPSVRLTRGTP